MRDAALPADLLDGRLAASPEPEDASSAARIAYVAQLAERGGHPAAAQEAAGLIEAGIHDIRLIGFYLFGLFLQRGVVCLPALLERAAALVADDLAALRPARRKLQVINSATAWLFEHVSAQLVFHTRHRGTTWEAWCGEIHGALPDAIATGCTKLTVALEAVIEAPLAAVPLARVRRWALEDLRRALVRREAAERADATATAAPTMTMAAPTVADAELDRDEPIIEPVPRANSAPTRIPAIDEPAARAHSGPTRIPCADEPVATGSPALAALQTKLAGFQTLVARGELAKAAIVASDVRAALASFDPVAYFPSMFAAYFKTLHEIIDELGPYLDQADLPSWHALDSYYRADVRAFFED
jgi:hypothetical protein